MRLLYRFYEATSGGIFVNGHEVRDITQQSLRYNIGLVPQGTLLVEISTERSAHPDCCL